MASTQIYLQKMFADMQTALSGVQTDIAGLVTKMDQQIAATGETVDAIGQIATEMTITSVGADKQKTIQSAGVLINTNQLVPMSGNIICKCDGTFFVKANFANINTVGVTAIFGYIKNGGAFVELGRNLLPAGHPSTQYTFPALSVNKGDILSLVCSATTINKVTVSNVTIHYAMHNIITDSPFIL